MTSAASAAELSRDLARARAAFESGSVDASRAAHEGRRTGTSPPSRGTGGGGGSGSGSGMTPSAEPGHYIGERSIAKSLVYSAIDGASTAVVITACAIALGLTLSDTARLLAGSVTALGVAHAARDYLRVQLGNDHYNRERARERWELVNYEQGEKTEMQELYETHGMRAEDARSVVDLLAKYSDLMVDHMMVFELGFTMNAAASGLGFLCSGSSLAATLLFLLRLLPPELLLVRHAEQSPTSPEALNASVPPLVVGAAMTRPALTPSLHVLRDNILLLPGSLAAVAADALRDPADAWHHLTNSCGDVYDRFLASGVGHHGGMPPAQLPSQLLIWTFLFLAGLLGAVALTAFCLRALRHAAVPTNLHKRGEVLSLICLLMAAAAVGFLIPMLTLLGRSTA